MVHMNAPGTSPDLVVGCTPHSMHVDRWRRSQNERGQEIGTIIGLPLSYELGEPRRVFGTGWMESDPKIWRGNGELTSINDFAGAKCFFNFVPFGSSDSEESSAFVALRRQFKMVSVTLRLGIRTFHIADIRQEEDSLGLPYWICQLPDKFE